MSNKMGLELYFGSNPTPELYRTVCYVPGEQKPVIGTRGTTIPTTGLPFIWGPASHSLALLFVSAIRVHLEGETPLFPLLEGPSTSPAGVIARLLTKRVGSWLHDLFGSDRAGRSLLHRMITLSNSRGKQPGPITATLRQEYLAPENIKIFMDGKDISKDIKDIAELEQILRVNFVPRKDPLAQRKISRARSLNTDEAVTLSLCA